MQGLSHSEKMADKNNAISHNSPAPTHDVPFAEEEGLPQDPDEGKSPEEKAKIVSLPCLCT